MARKVSLYPPSPDLVPDELTTPTGNYILHGIVVLLSILTFFLLYLGLLFGSIIVLVWSILTWSRSDSAGWIRITLILVCGLVALFLVKGFFKRRGKSDKSMSIELTEKDEPKLFKFIETLCDETGTEFPNRVILGPEVNASVSYESLYHALILPTPKNLYIGLGLLNMLNLSEFKAVLAHEFGHFSQKTMKFGIYTYTANQLIYDMVYGRDFLDDILTVIANLDLRIWLIMAPFRGLIWLLRMILAGLFRMINFANSALSRQMEFHADLVAVSVTGSDALVHALSRLSFADDALGQALHDLEHCKDRKLFSRNLYYHQTHAAGYLRKMRKNQQLGIPPVVPDDPNLTVEVFEPLDANIPAMWASHPPNYDREENIKSTYIRCEIDERSPWILFTNPEKWCEKITYNIYRLGFKVKKGIALADAEEVQDFINEEHAEASFDPKYQGRYDYGVIYPGELDTQIETLKRNPWTEEALANAYAELHGSKLQKRMENHRAKIDESDMLEGLVSGEKKTKDGEFEFRGRTYEIADAKGLAKKVQKELKKDDEWLETFDHKVFLIHYQMAKRNKRQLEELIDRYAFQTEVQKFCHEIREHQMRISFALNSISSGEASHEDFQFILSVLREAHKILRKGLARMKALTIPKLKNMKKTQSLHSYLLDEDLIYELDREENNIRGKWVEKLQGQMDTIRTRLYRIMYKGLGELLNLQEAIAEEWNKNWNADVVAEVEEADEGEVEEGEVPTLEIVEEPTPRSPAKKPPPGKSDQLQKRSAKPNAAAKTVPKKPSEGR